MSAIIAADGYIKVGGAGSTNASVAYVDSASLNINNNTVDITGLGAGWHEYAGTIRDWGGNLSFTLDLSDAGQSRIFELMTGSSRVSGVALEMALGGVKKISGTVMLQDFNLSAPVNGVVGASCSYKGNGAPTVSAITA